MAQDETANDREKLYDLLKDVRIAMLTTLESDGSLHTRPMANQEADADGDLWFFTEKGSAVETNVRNNPQVSLGFSDPHGDRYVSISGTGTLTDDRATIHEKWNDSLKAWFPGGQEDPSILLLRVNPRRGEFWETASSTLLRVAGFVKAKLGGGPPTELTDQAKVSLQ